MVEVATRDRSRETLGHVFETALRERDYLVVMRLALDGAGQELDGRAAVDGEHVDERFERQALCRPQPAVVARALLEVGPGQLDVAAKRSQKHVDESGRRGDEILSGLLAERDQLGRAGSDDLHRLTSAFS